MYTFFVLYRYLEVYYDGYCIIFLMDIYIIRMYLIDIHVYPVDIMDI